MKITRIETLRLNVPHQASTAEPRRASWWETDEVANPMSVYPHVKRHRDLWRPKWPDVWVRVTAEDGRSGLGQTINGAAVAAVIEQHLGPQLLGQDAMATDTLADMMFRLTKPYGTVGLASYAISALDLALWDLKGKALGKPVYELLGGPSKPMIPCYATGNDVDWHLELGFDGFKLACPYGPADGKDGIKRNEDFVAKARETIGPDRTLRLDCWMAFDVDYAVELAEALRPYNLAWMEECLIPEDFDAHIELRRRLPWQTLTTGEHWYTHVPFQWAAKHKVVDILQPDLNWCGGLSTCWAVAEACEESGMAVIPHVGGNTAFGQHFTLAASSSPMCECFIAAPPGVPLEDHWRLPGVARPVDGQLTPSDAPGFGLEIPDTWFEPFFARSAD